MMNKKADITITILVIGVVAICALALLSFLSSSFKHEQSFIGVAQMEEMGSKIQQYNFYKSQGISENELKELLDIKEDEDGEYLHLEKKSSKFLFWKDEFLFSVKYIIPRT